MGDPWAQEASGTTDAEADQQQSPSTTTASSSSSSSSSPEADAPTGDAGAGAAASASEAASDGDTAATAGGVRPIAGVDLEQPGALEAALEARARGSDKEIMLLAVGGQESPLETSVRCLHSFAPT